MHFLLLENKRTLRLALPIIVGHLGQMLLGLTDTLMIGRLGTVELAAVAFVNILVHVILVIGIGLSVAVSIQVSHAHGARADRSAAEALRHGLVLSLALGALIFLVMMLGRPLLNHLGQPPEVIAVLPAYLAWVAASMIGMMPVMVIKAFAEAQNHPWPVFGIQFAGVFLNILLNAALIFGKWGFPAYGLAGAGLATFLSRLLTLAAMFLYLQRARRFAHTRPPRWRRSLSVREFRILGHLAVPITAQMLMEFGSFSIGALLIGRFGSISLAAHQIAMTCATTTYMLPMGLAGALGIRVGNSLGHGEWDDCRRMILAAQALTLITMATFGVLYLLFGAPLAALFTSDPELIALAASLLAIVGVFQLFDGIQVVSISALRAIKDVKVPTLLSFIGYWVIALPFGITLSLGLNLGARGFWMGLAAGLTLAALSMTTRLVLVLKQKLSPPLRNPHPRD